MANVLQIKRGQKSNLPVLSNGEPAFVTDENKVYIGDGSSNYAVTMDAEADVSTKGWVLDEDDFASNSNTKVPTQQSVKAYADGLVVGLYDHKGSYDASTNTPDLDDTPSGTGIKKGDAYTVSAAGDFFTEYVNVGDVLIADMDDPSSLSDWTRIQKNIQTATTSTAGIVELATDGESSSGVVVQGNDARLSDARTPTAHAGSHVDGGSDEINGDLLDITIDPTNYSPDSGVTEANDTDDLAAHLAGIDTAIGNAGGSDTQVAVASYTNPGYLGDANNNGVLRTEAPLTYFYPSSSDRIEIGVDKAAFFEDAPTDGTTTKGPDSDWAYGHTNAATGVHGAGSSTLLHSSSTIDGGTF